MNTPEIFSAKILRTSCSPSIEVIDRLKRKDSPIIVIDEPDLFLHEGLQKKLKLFLNDKSNNMQIFYTTHSRIFLDTYKMKNVFFLDSNNYEQYSARRKRNVSVIETKKVNIEEDGGYNKICDHLGIGNNNEELLEEFNIIVEGNCDKHYLSELAKYFDLKEVKIISLNGADNAVKTLDFYNSYYQNKNSFRPYLKVVFDNDVAGRNNYKIIDKRSKHYQYINVNTMLLPNCTQYNAPPLLDGCKINNEMEDFLYPELTCYLINEWLKKTGMNCINDLEICNSIKQRAFKDGGILALCNHKKNEANPDKGAEISFVNSDKATNRFKESLAGLFKIEGSRKIIGILEKCDNTYPYVRLFLEKLYTKDV